jgi:DNA modification methylase
MKDHPTEQTSFEFEEFKTIKGYPELRWTGKRPYTSTQYYPAQLKEVFGQPDEDGWMNKIFWGDNLQVMSHMLREYRGKIDLIYIDPPFDSKAEYKKKIRVRGAVINSGSSFFEDKQYSDIWTNDEYLQFMYERLLLLKELLSNKGSIYLHCDWHKSHHLRMLMDEVFGSDNFVNEIIWQYFMGGKGKKEFAKKHDTIFLYSKSKDYKFNQKKIKRYLDFKPSLKDDSEDGELGQDEIGYYSIVSTPDVWQIRGVFNMGSEYTSYPTQKPIQLLERIIQSSSDEGDLVFDCFMGSGTTQVVAQSLNRRFIGADINLTAMQTTSKRLLNLFEESTINDKKSTGFLTFNVNNYEYFNNPIDAKSILVEALGINIQRNNKLFDGELDGRNIKIMPINRIASKVDLNEIIANLPYETYRNRQEESPNAPVDQITLICMGHEPDLLSEFKKQTSTYKIDIEILDILTDKKDLEFKREAKANIEIIDGKLIIQSFYPMNLLQKLSIQQENVGDYRQLVESIMIDYNYDGVALRPTVIDIPEKNALVVGSYILPETTSRIRVKITDLISESLEIEVTNNG